MPNLEVVMGQRFAIGAAFAGLLFGGVVSAQQAKPTSAPQPKPTAAAKPAAAPAGPVLVIETQKGNIEIETYNDAPKSLEHILKLVRDGFYRGQRFLYVAPNAVQFGDPYTKDMTKTERWGSGGSGTPVGVAETSKRKFDKGTLILYYATGYPGRLADSQMIILKQPNPTIEGKYAPLGKVKVGMDVVDKLEVGDRIVKMYVKGEPAK
jgi:peptidyl-prolyl cis-trans isomerase B (cyclophilin B)